MTINSHSIVSDVNTEEPVPSGLSYMAQMIRHPGVRAKDAASVLAVLALGALDAPQAMRLTCDAERFLEKHLAQTHYKLAMVGPTTVRVTAITPQQNLEPTDLVFERDLARL